MFQDEENGRADNIHYEAKVTAIGSINIEMVFESGNISSARVLHGRGHSTKMIQDAELAVRILTGLFGSKNFDGDITFVSTIGFS